MMRQIMVVVGFALVFGACGEEEAGPNDNGITVLPDMGSNTQDMGSDGTDSDTGEDASQDLPEAEPEFRLDLQPRPLLLARQEQARITAALVDDEGGELEIETIEFSSLNPEIASVDDGGLILALGPGEAIIQVTANQVYTATIGVTVYTLYDSLALGEEHSCATKADGRVVCWGANDFAQAGAMEGPSLVPEAIQVAGEAAGIDVFAGAFHSCVVLADGVARCWGNNASGELGDDEGGSRPSATTSLSFATAVREAALGDGFTCVKLQDDTLRCVGDNRNQVIENSSVQTIRSPVSTQEGQEFIEITAGRAHVCGISPEFRVLCWGDNSAGQLGPMGPEEGSHSPIPLNNGNYIAISAYDDHTCAYSPIAGLECWGESNGGFGEAGVTQSDTPVAVDIPAGALRDLAVGADFGCVVVDDNVICWGENSSGQLGDQTTTSRPTAAPAVGGTGLFPIECGRAHCCGISQTGDLFCWGENQNGQVGDGSTTDRRVPTYIFPTAF